MYGKIKNGINAHKKLLLLFCIVVILVATSLTVFSKIRPRKLTEVEQITLNNFNEKVLPYLDQIDTETDHEAKRDEKLIAFAILYAHDEQAQSEFTLDQINDIIDDFFEAKISKTEFDPNAPSSYLAQQGIHYDMAQEKYIYHQVTKSKKEIAQTPLYAYSQKDATIKGDVINVTYSKYLIKNPYDLFTAAATSNQNTAGVGDYLAGEGKAKDIKRLLTPENAEYAATYQKDYALRLEIKDGKILANF